MSIDFLRDVCGSLPGVTEEIKWGNDLCFLIAGKMFCVTSLDPPHNVSFKVEEEEFEELVNRENIIPAPYLARYKWVQVHSSSALPLGEWKRLLTHSYELVKAKLSPKLRSQFNL